jgi:hypothetical protein
MLQSSKKLHAWLIMLTGVFMLSSLQTHALSLRDTRDFCKRHRFAILAVTSAAVVYLYTHKLIKKAIHDYSQAPDNGKCENKQDKADCCEACADAIIKATKLLGTLFKVFRAATCPDEGKVAGDQWLDDFSQLA